MAEPAPPPPPQTKPARRRLLLLAVTLVFVVAGAAAALRWYYVGQYRTSTDDAYVGGNMVQITPQMEGTVIAIHADETDAVRQGEVLMQLDDASATATLEQAKAALADTVRQTAELFAHAAQLRAVIEQRRADLALAEDAARRREALGSRKLIAEEDAKRAQLAAAAARAGLAAAERELDAATALIRNSSVERFPSVLHAEAALKSAYIDWRRTTLPAPVDGYVAKRAVQLGQRVKAGDRLMAVVPLEHVWVDANFKEDEIAAVRIGQPVTLTADLYGGDVVFHGRVQGIGAGTGASFALLPPQNASGNWIKIVHRVPVRIALDTQELAAHPLRIGLSMRAIIDTHRRDGAVLTSTAAAARAETTPVYTAPDTDIDRIIIDIVRANAPPAAERPPR